jgi:hypothetical protein
MLEACHFPDIKEPFATALRQVVEFAMEHYNPIGIIAAGSVMRGQGDATSDIDLFVLFEGDYRQLVHRYFNGVPVQIFCNPPQRIPRYFEDEPQRLDGGPSTAHMLATGVVILDRDSRVEQFRQMAHAALKKPPNPNPALVQLLRYHAVDALENALDLRESDPTMAMIAVCDALPQMLRYYFVKQGKYIPRHKDMLKHIRDDNPELATLLDNLFSVADDSRFDIIQQIADKTIEARRFFEHEFPPEKI